jgi:hypothetical protein
MIKALNQLRSEFRSSILNLVDKGKIFEINQNYRGVLFEYEKISLKEEI